MPSLLPLLLPFIPGSGSSTPDAATEVAFAVEVAWNDTPRSASPTYYDATDLVRASSGLSFQRGRSNEQDAQAQPGRAGFELFNDDGSLTIGDAGWTYDPIRLRRPCRVRATYGSATYPLWQGFVDSWENGTDNTLGTVRVSASDRLARTARVKLPGYVEGEILADSPSAYFPLGDSAESTTAGDLSTRGVSPLTVTQVGTGGVAELGVGTSPGPDGGTVAAFTPVTTGDFQHLVTTDVGQFGYDSTGGYTVSCFALTTVVEPDTNILSYLVYLASSNAVGGNYIVLGGDKLAGYGPSISDGEWHHLAFVSDYDANTGSWYVDGTLVLTSTAAHGVRDTLYVGGYPGGAFSGQLAHVAVFPQPLSATRIAAHAAAGLTSNVGELTSDRFERLCLHGGLPSTHYASSAGLSTMAAQPTRGVALLDALKACAEAENGYVAVDSAGVLRFSPRTDRYAASSSLTLNAQLGGHVGDDFTYITDDSLIVNDVTVTRPGGPTQRAVDTDSVAAYDTQDESLTLYLDTDAEAQAAAQWRVFSYSEPLARASGLTIDLAAFAANAGNVPALLSLELGSVVTITNLPDDVSVTSSVDLIVEGVSWRVGTSGAQVSLTTSPLGSAGVAFIFDDSTFGAFDGAGRFAY